MPTCVTNKDEDKDVFLDILLGCEVAVCIAIGAEIIPRRNCLPNVALIVVCALCMAGLFTFSDVLKIITISVAIGAIAIEVKVPFEIRRSRSRGSSSSKEPRM